MADRTAPGGPSGSAPERVIGQAARTCRFQRATGWALGVAAAVVAAAVVQSFVPRGHRGRRRLRRARPWRRGPLAAALRLPALEGEPGS